MNTISVSLIVLACVFGGALLGLFLRNALPEHHLSADAKDVVRLGTGLIGTIAALVLGLLIASAKSSFDTQSAQVKQMTAQVVLLDNLLAQYGQEAAATRALLRPVVAIMADRVWRESSSGSAQAAPFTASQQSETFFAKLHQFAPTNDTQRSLKDRAIQASTDLAQTRLLLFAEADNQLPTPFLVVLVFWLTIIFASFSLFAQPNAIVIGSLFLFAPRNATVIAAFLLSGLSISGAIFLILELDRSFEGVLQVSSAPLRAALARLGEL